jgi:hypothetical protein
MLAPRAHASDEEKVKKYKEVVRNYLAFSDMFEKVMEKYPGNYTC